MKGKFSSPKGGKRICIGCGTSKEKNAFYLDALGKVSSNLCRVCTRAKDKERKAKKRMEKLELDMKKHIRVTTGARSRWEKYKVVLNRKLKRASQVKGFVAEGPEERYARLKREKERRQRYKARLLANVTDFKAPADIPKEAMEHIKPHFYTYVEAKAASLRDQIRFYEKEIRENEETMNKYRVLAAEASVKMSIVIAELKELEVVKL